MNPYTQSLLKEVKDRRLVEFVRRWDALEALVIRVFKNQSASGEDEAGYRRLRAWLHKDYPRWKAALLPYWPRALVAGEPAGEDPFVFLLSVPEASGFVRNWQAMQTLPAAREALNLYLQASLPPPSYSSLQPPP